MIIGVNSSIAATNALQANREMKHMGENKIQESKEVAPNRISEIKEQIANGTYAIDIDKTSKKMALDLLNL